MSLKVLSIVFLLLVSLSVICNMAVAALESPEQCSEGEPTDVNYGIHGGGGDEDGPDAGDPVGGGGWP